MRDEREGGREAQRHKSKRENEFERENSNRER